MAKKSDLIVLASAKAKPGKEKELEQALLDVAKPTRAQPGSVAFSLHRSIEDPAVFIGLERWASKEEHNRHLQGAHVQKLMAAMANILAEPPKIVSYEIIDEE
jgi:quinol monooxygenase YgiN